MGFMESKDYDSSYNWQCKLFYASVISAMEMMEDDGCPPHLKEYIRSRLPYIARYAFKSPHSVHFINEEFLGEEYRKYSDFIEQLKQFGSDSNEMKLQGAHPDTNL